MLIRVAALLAAVCLALAPAARAQDGHGDPKLEASSRLRNIGAAIYWLAHESADELPPDLGTVLHHMIARDPSKSETELLSTVFTTPGLRNAPALPDTAGAEWASDHSPFEYLGRPGVFYSEVPDWPAVALGHLKLEHAFPGERTPDNPTGEHLPVLFVDQHVEFMTRAQAEAVIADSKKIYDALATGAPLPDHYQAEADLTRLGRAILAYAKANKGTLPPDLGVTLSYMPAEGKRGATPAQRARCYLAPHAASNIHIPDAPDADWINRNTSYTYLAANILLPEIDDSNRLLLLHAKPGHEITRPRDPDHTPLTPVLTVSGGALLARSGDLDAIARETRDVYDAIRNKKPLPEYHHALRDLRILWQAIDAFAKEHNGSLPYELSATLPYLDQDRFPTDSDKARLYLSPKAERARGQIPATIDAAWIRASASYNYLGHSTITLDRVRGVPNGRGLWVILHGPMDEAYTVRRWHDTADLIPVKGAGRVWGATLQELQERIADDLKPEH